MWQVARMANGIKVGGQRAITVAVTDLVQAGSIGVSGS